MFMRSYVRFASKDFAILFPKILRAQQQVVADIRKAIDTWVRLPEDLTTVESGFSRVRSDVPYKIAMLGNCHEPLITYTAFQPS